MWHIFYSSAVLATAYQELKPKALSAAIMQSKTFISFNEEDLYRLAQGLQKTQ